jgi:hypothetical protein
MKKFLTSIFAVLLTTVCFAQNSGPIHTTQLNATYYVAPYANSAYPSIQSAITAACTQTGANVVIPAYSSPSDTIAGVTTACASVAVTDERGGSTPGKYSWNGAALVLASGSSTTSRIPAFVQTSPVVTGTAGAAPWFATTYMSANTTAGNAILAVARCDGTTGGGLCNITGFADTQGNTYTVVSSGAGFGAVIYLATNIKGGADAITVSGGGNTPQFTVRAVEYKNVTSASAVDATTSSGGYTNSTTFSITTTVAKDILVTLTTNATGATITGFTQRTTGVLVVHDALAASLGSNSVPITATSGAGGAGNSVTTAVALKNGIPAAAATPLPSVFATFVPGLQTSNNQVYLAVPITTATSIPFGCTGTYAGGTVAAAGTTVFTVVRHAASINGTADTSCTLTWSASGTAAVVTGNGDYYAPGDWMFIVGAATPDAALANIAAGVNATH